MATPKNRKSNSARATEFNDSDNEPTPFDDTEQIEASYNNEVHDLVKEIDYADKGFILQNLSMATPKYKEDSTFVLQGRKDIIELLSHQVCFLTYCALLAFVKRPAQPTILVYGDGYMGSRIINELVKYELSPYLKIFSRGIIKAKEWKEKGLTSNCSILHLLNGVRPDIIILCSESSNFGPISNQILGNQITNKSTCIITASFGVERRKILGSLNVQSIFRTFCEPIDVTKKVKYRLFGADVFKKKKKKKEKGDTDFSDSDDDDSDMGDSLSRARGLSFDDDDDDADLENEEEGGEEEGGEKKKKEKEKVPMEDPDAGLNDIQISANVFAKRSMDLKYFIHILENFYVLNGMNVMAARQNALKAVCGYDYLAEKEAESMETRDVNGVFTEDSYVLPLIPPVPYDTKGSDVPILGRYYNHNLRSALDTMHAYKCGTFQKQLTNFISLEKLQNLATRPIGVGDNGETLDILVPSTPGKSKRYSSIYSDAYVKSLFDKDCETTGYKGTGFEYMAFIDGKLKQKLLEVGLSSLLHASVLSTPASHSFDTQDIAGVEDEGYTVFKRDGDGDGDDEEDLDDDFEDIKGGTAGEDIYTDDGEGEDDDDDDDDIEDENSEV